MKFKQDLAPKVLQFGEGNFLRAFADWMIQKANDTINLNMGVVIVQPLVTGLVDKLKQQNCSYNVILEGVKDGTPIRETQKIECILDAINPYSEYEKYKAYFLDPELEFIISNTTEAGISRLEGVNIFAQPPVSFPAKIIALLHERFNHFNGDINKGLSIICCELIENNASILKEIVIELAEANKLSTNFIKWVNESCAFCNSLVDRIVTGFPKDAIVEIQKELRTEDNLVVVCEYYHLWVIEGDLTTKAKFPLQKAGLNVLWLDELDEFRDKKVRVLNGAHTALVPIGLLSGYATVKEAFADDVVSNYIYRLIEDEVLPNIKGDTNELKQFTNKILERFFNPYINHYLKDISLNSISKWITRDWPSLIDDFERTGMLPQRLSFSLAALLVLYSDKKGIGFQPNDTNEYLAEIESVWADSNPIEEKVSAILSNNEIWGKDVSALKELHCKVAVFVQEIICSGIKEPLVKLEIV